MEHKKILFHFTCYPSFHLCTLGSMNLWINETLLSISFSCNWNHPISVPSFLSPATLTSLKSLKDPDAPHSRFCTYFSFCLECVGWLVLMAHPIISLRSSLNVTSSGRPFPDTLPKLQAFPQLTPCISVCSVCSCAFVTKENTAYLLTYICHCVFAPTWGPAPEE